MVSRACWGNRLAKASWRKWSSMRHPVAAPSFHCDASTTCVFVSCLLLVVCLIGCLCVCCACLCFLWLQCMYAGGVLVFRCALVPSRGSETTCVLYVITRRAASRCWATTPPPSQPICTPTASLAGLQSNPASSPIGWCSARSSQPACTLWRHPGCRRTPTSPTATR